MSKKVELVFSGLYVFFECMFTFYPVGLTEKRFFSEQDTPSPFPRIDLDDYVTKSSLDGLLEMVGNEEKKIRKDPTARVTDLLQQVFK
jgi:hypothetical protein